jgi:hypothetical protein
MRTRNALLATAALLVSAVLAAPAFAASLVPTLSNFGDPDTMLAGQSLIADFNDPSHPAATVQPGYTLTLDGATVGFQEGVGGYSGTLFGDDTHYLTIPGGTSVTLTAIKALKSFSFYMGSPDEYNSIRFIGAGGFDVIVPGHTLVLGDTNQSWSWGKRVNFDFGGNTVNTIILSSAGNSFEVDNFAGGAVPEAGTWAMMLLGFGAMGAAFRARRPVTSLA